MIPNNYTIPQVAYDIDKNSLYNTGCINEIHKVTDMCTNFKLSVYQSMNTNFTIAICVMFALVLFRILTIYRPLPFQKLDFYKRYLEYRVDFIIVCLIIFYVAYYFFL